MKDEYELSRPHIRSRISYNALVRLGGRALGGLVSLGALHLAARYFQPRGWGPIVAAMALVGLFSSLADFGVSSVLARDLVTGDEKEALFGTGIATALAISLAATAVAALVAGLAFASLPTARDLAFILLPTIPASAVFAALSSVFIARSRNDVRALFDVMSSVLPLVGVLTIVGLRLGQESYGVVVAATSTVMTVLAFAVALRYLRPRARGLFGRVRPLLQQAWPMGMSQLLGAVYLQIDVLLVVAFLSPADVGWYGLASQVAAFFAAVPGMVTVAATPAFMQRDWAGRQQLARRLLMTLAGGASLTALIGLLLPRMILGLIGGHRYLPAAGALRILLVAAGVTFLVRTFSTVIYLTGNQRYMVRIGMATFFSNLAANLILIPLAGIEGAAGALLLSELIALSYSYAVAQRLGYSLLARPIGRRGDGDL